jgi:hypothetical protein
MPREVKARFFHGKIEPLEELDLKDGDQITILVREDFRVDDAAAKAAFERSAGSWEGTLDFGEFLTDLRNGRKRSQRPPVDLE